MSSSPNSVSCLGRLNLAALPRVLTAILLLSCRKVSRDLKSYFGMRNDGAHIREINIASRGDTVRIQMNLRWFQRRLCTFLEEPPLIGTRPADPVVSESEGVAPSSAGELAMVVEQVRGKLMELGCGRMNRSPKGRFSCILPAQIAIVVAMGIRPTGRYGWVGSDVDEEGATRVASSCRLQTRASWHPQRPPPGHLQAPGLMHVTVWRETGQRLQTRVRIGPNLPGSTGRRKQNTLLPNL